jgi:glycosyltransferase involved in cell wall biosynthesis
MPRPRKAKILFLVTEDWYFCSHRLPIARAARDAGMEVAVATNVTDHGAAIRKEGFRLIPLAFRRGSLNPLNEARCLIALFRLYRQERPDLVHHVAIKPVLYGSFVAWLLRVPAVVNALAGLGFIFTSPRRKARALRPFASFALRFLLNRVPGRVILQNPDDQRTLKRVAHLKDGRSLVIAGSGVDMDHFQALSEPSGTPVTVAIVSRMLIDKGILDLIEAARCLRRQGVTLRILLFGLPDPENPSSISQTQLEAWTAEGIAEWRGFERDVRRVWQEADFAILPSCGGEGLPKSLLEAAACARAIVTTDVPGCRSVVQPEKTGLLVPPGNAQALAAAMARLAGDADLRASMGKQGRLFVAEFFSERVIVKQTMTLYRDLLGR